MEEIPKKKPRSALELLKEAIQETKEEERELERYFREMMKESLLQKEIAEIQIKNEGYTKSETDSVFKFRKTPIPFFDKLIDREGIKNKKLNLKRETAGIEIKIEYLDRKHNELEEEKLNINKEIDKIKMLEKNMREQFNDLGGEEWEGPPSFVHISWMEEAFQTNESGWSEVSRHEYSVYMEEIKRREIKNPLPIGSGICYVLSVPENENWSKIGFTTKSAQVRADDYSKQHDLELNVAGIIADDNAAALEKILHEEFSSKRVEHGTAKEIFAVSPQEAIKKIKSYKRKISEEMQNRQLLILGSELIKIDAKIGKEMYKISSIDETIALIILEQRKLFREKLYNNYRFNIRPNSRKRWYRLFGWKVRLRRYAGLFIYILLGVILFSGIFSLSYYLIGKVTILLALVIIIIILLKP